MYGLISKLKSLQDSASVSRRLPLMGMAYGSARDPVSRPEEM